MDFRIPAQVLLAGAGVSAALTPVSLWWALPTAACAFRAGARPGRTRGTALALLVVVVAAVAVVAAVPTWMVWGGRFVVVLVGAGMLPWFAGRFHRQYQELVQAGWERAARLEREQRLVAEQARLRERTRIAQDMHDLLGHDLSLIALSAGALQLAPGLSQEHRAAARSIRAGAGGAVERLAEIIGVLRGGGDGGRPGDRVAAAGLDHLADPEDVGDLVRRAAAAGLDVRLLADGSPPDGLPPAVERAVCRVVQEALTNSVKHAQGAAATVTVRYGMFVAEVEVTNGPPPSTSPDSGAGSDPGAAGSGSGSGSGLVGLDERVRLAGGSFAAGPRGGGFTVRARLPYHPSAAVPRADGPTATQAEEARPAGTDARRAAAGSAAERRRARKGLGRTAVAAVLVPMATAVLLFVGLRAWDVLTARQSVLPADDFASLRVGQLREDIAPVLPDRQTTARPARPTPFPPGAACEHYVATADPFDDLSGDVYRLCFLDGRLASADHFTGRAAL
ncbi:sensor histidine kinase [Streptomyces sp. NRRL S-244]|uniref:sensor histidine kinase n=1 Tax=Streptomyces sp. NRRL S-244 TaxID=1463897 RepID=UPI000997E5A1|nr:histidine kinase [Streptomyces sp. NRRL S-244]